MEVGDKFPEFVLEDENGDTFDSKMLDGIRYVIYFYSKDNTPGCTKEAVEFSAMFPKLMLRNIPVIGVSKDSVKSHRNFIDKQQLKVKLLSDPDHVLMEAAGVWQLKKNYGKEYMGAVRSTFVVGKDGVVEAAWKNVKVADHAEKVTDKALSLANKSQ